LEPFGYELNGDVTPITANGSISGLSTMTLGTVLSMERAQTEILKGGLQRQLALFAQKLLQDGVI
jgi:hypothetical protein